MQSKLILKLFVTLCHAMLRLFTVPYFPVRLLVLIVQFDGPPSLDASETGESTNCPWVEAVGLIAWGGEGGAGVVCYQNVLLLTAKTIYIQLYKIFMTVRAFSLIDRCV